MSRNLSIELNFKNDERVVFRYGDLYPGSLLKVLRNSATKSINYPDIWVNLLNIFQQKFGPCREYLVFVSPLHTTVPSIQSVEEEVDELRARNAENSIFIEGETEGRKYLFFNAKSDNYLEDLVYRYYDSGMKIFLAKESVTTVQIGTALSPIGFEEGKCSTEVFKLIVEINFPAGNECFITAGVENEYLVKDALERLVFKK